MFPAEIGALNQLFEPQQSTMQQAKRIFQWAQEVTWAYDFFDARKQGSGSAYTKEVIDALDYLVMEELGVGIVNQFLCKESRQMVDFWLPDEHAIVELELNLASAAPLLEKEVVKALLAKDAGQDVRQLILIGDPGSLHRHQSSTAKAVIKWAERQHQLRVEIWELLESPKT
jgi:hypothetical protein